MPRHGRIVLSDVAAHVVQRGNNRAPCFFADGDRSYYLFHLGRLLAPAGCALHAYCLMGNHVHLLLTPSNVDGCARLMKQLGQLHAQYINRTYKRTGTLWEGRFKSCLVQSERYALACYRYIEMNPVRAGIVAHPEDYLWSSFRANARGAGEVPITPHPEYLRLGRNDPERRAAYRDLFASMTEMPLADDIRAATSGGFVLADAGFCSEAAAQLGRRVERALPGRSRQVPVAREGQCDLFSRG